MAFLTQRFPDRIARGAVGGPGFLTNVVVLTSGVESRNIEWSLARGRWNVSQSVKEGDEERELNAFFYKARGKARAFRFKDWLDFELEYADSRLVSIDSTHFQIAKVYGADEPTFEYVRNLTRIVSSTYAIKQNGTLLVEGPGAGKYTLDVDTGIVAFGTAPGMATLTATCEFDVPCRFDFDDKQGELVHRRADGSTFVRWEGITLLEVRE